MKTEEEIREKINSIKEDIAYFKEEYKRHKEMDYHIRVCNEILVYLEWVLEE